MTGNNSRFGGSAMLVFVLYAVVISMPFASALEGSPEGTGVPGIEYAHELKAQGVVALQGGRLDEGMQYLAEARDIYFRLSETASYVETLLYIGDAYHKKRRYRESNEVLGHASALAGKFGLDARLAAIKAAIGRNYYGTGRYDQAGQYLNESLALARKKGDSHLAAVVLNDLGTVHALQGDLKGAYARYSESATVAERSGNRVTAAKAYVNSAVVLSDDHGKGVGSITSMLDLALAATKILSDSQDKARLLIEIARLNQDNFERFAPSALQGRAMAVHDMTREALNISVQWGDLHGESYALGGLGRLYETTGRYDDALHYTRRALFVAQQTQDSGILFRLLWQAGRIHSALGNVEEAVKLYRQAIFNLQSIRHGVRRHHVDSEASFRREVRAVYDGFLELLLGILASTGGEEARQSILVEVRSTIEDFKAAELRNYFQDDCVDSYREGGNMLNYAAPDTAIVYPVIFENKLNIVVSFYDGFRWYEVGVESARLVGEVVRFRGILENSSRGGYVAGSKHLYEWLFKPYENDLIESGVETVIFVPDGVLRLLPLGALHDGRQYLVERFVFAKSPGLTLTDSQSMDRDDISIMSAGLTKSVQGFPSLPFVSNELDSIGALYRTTRVQDEEFLLENVDKELARRSYPVVHIATHGQFKSNAQDSFLLTYDGKMTMSHLARFIERSRYGNEPIELLTLSACQTATGDDQAALGLAGLSVRSGARSALATLWLINDEASSILMAEFYRQLKDSKISKAKALQRAQVKLLSNRRYQHPGYWSAFLLIGNWL